MDDRCLRCGRMCFMGFDCGRAANFENALGFGDLLRKSREAIHPLGDENS